MGLGANQLHQIRAAELISHLPGLRLVQPHQRRINAHALGQAQIQRQLLGFHGVVAAIGVARIIGLADTCDDHRQAPAIGHRPGQREKQQVAARHKGIGQAIGLHGKGHIVGQRGATDLLEHIQRQHMVVAQTRRPLWKALRELLAHAAAHLHLHAVALAVIKAQRLHTFIHGQGLGQTGGGVLATGKQHQRSLVRASAGTGNKRGRHRGAITSPSV